MIARVWRGWTNAKEGDAYETYLRTNLLTALARRVSGFRGGYVLRRDLDDESEFVVITHFDSLEAVRAFAGDDYEAPVIEPEAARLLSRYDERALHYDAVIVPE
jgi:heme-degrading monooxygenase HmoA